MSRNRREIRAGATRALRTFVATEVAGGLVLVFAAAAALVWANSPWDGAYERLWETHIAFTLGDWEIELELREWVNDGLMAIFFLVVGLEVKRELVEGELRDPRHAALPVIAAFGGMVVPALLYTAVNAGGDASQGWGIPMATDIAFALGVAALVARTLPPSLRLFLLTLAIVDDIGAILVIAVFYSGGIDWAWLASGLVILAVAYVLRQMGFVFAPIFVMLGIGLWLSLHESGVHATLAGVAMGLLAPAKPALNREMIVSRTDELLDVFSPEAAQRTSRLARLSVSQMEWLEHGLHPWTSLLIVPIFAVANAGVALSSDDVGDALSSSVTLGVVLGLVVGKTVGITVFSWVGCRLGFAQLPSGSSWSQIVGMAALAGIGFTVSLFITGLAFDEAQLIDEAKVGIIASSVLASGIGALILMRARYSIPAPAATPAPDEPLPDQV